MTIKRPKFLLILFIPLIFLISPAAAQNADSNNSTAIFQIDESTKIVDQEWGDGGVTLTFESDIPRVATIVDANSMPLSGAAEMNHKQVSLAAGRTEVTMDLTNKRGSKTATISIGDTLVGISSPSKPLLESITRADFYIFGIIAAISSAVQVLIRRAWMRYRLKRGLMRIF